MADTEVGAERRQGRRLGFRRLVKIRASEHSQETIAATAVDVSDRGLRILVHERIGEGTRVLLDFPESSDGRSLSLAGETVWVRPVEGEPAVFECGIRFTETQEQAGSSVFGGSIGAYAL